MCDDTKDTLENNKRVARRRQSVSLLDWLGLLGLKKVAKMLCLNDQCVFSDCCANNVDVETSERTRRVYRWSIFLCDFLFLEFGCHSLLSDDPLLLRLEGGHAVALELLSGPALGSGALVDDVAGHDERVLEQAGVRLHASAGE